MERVSGTGTGMPMDSPVDLSTQVNLFPVMTDSSLRELCHDLIEPAATIRWLAQAARAESGERLHDRLAAIAATAGQIAAICTDILDPPLQCPHVRLDKIAAEAVAGARTRYAGVIDFGAEPVTALTGLGDTVRIVGNILANACRVAGPGGRVAVEVSPAGPQARLTIADSGHGPAGPAASGGTGLGLEIVCTLVQRYGGTVQLGISDLGGLAITVQVPAQGRSCN
jgi:signal transduction histidine kinase